MRSLGGDIAEEFEAVDAAVASGAVVVVAGADRVRPCSEGYDRRVVGLVPGACGYRPALIFDPHDRGNRRPVALSARVWCKVDADPAPVGFSDMLITSQTTGQAMRATESGRLVPSSEKRLEPGEDAVSARSS